MEHAIGKIIEYKGEKFLVTEIIGPFSCGRCFFESGRRCPLGSVTPYTRKEKMNGWVSSDIVVGRVVITNQYASSMFQRTHNSNYFKQSII
jgi:hypothetical protein